MMTTESSRWAAPGVRCVCVDARPGEHPDSIHTVPFVKNGIYTIYALKAIGDVPVVQVDGHGLDGRVYAANGWWIRLSRFRPLVSRTQSEDLGLFLPLLTTSTQERVDVLGEMLDAAWRESRRD